MTEVAIVEVGPRDGFQSIAEVIPAERKKALIDKLYHAGVRRMEVTSFVSEAALPQFRDAAEILAFAQGLSGMDPQVLVPTARHAERALRAGADHLAFVLSVSERHNRGNVRRSPLESAAEYDSIAAMMPGKARLRLNVATAFDCPHDGPVDEGETMRLLERLVPVAPAAEIALCDTTGRVAPAQVQSLFSKVRQAFGDELKLAFHAHDTYGLGAANTFAAYQTGVRVFDAAAAGLGGCPFAPGATGNVATEDLIYMFDGMRVNSGIDLARLLDAAADIADVPGAQTGGRVRTAAFARACRASEG